VRHEPTSCVSPFASRSPPGVHTESGAEHTHAIATTPSRTSFAREEVSVLRKSAKSCEPEGPQDLTA
jgi:hypothetical protein